MIVMLEFIALQRAEIPALAHFIASQQAQPSSYVGFCGSQPNEIAHELSEFPDLPDQDTRYKYDVLQPGDTTFVVPNSRIGRLVVAFLLDEEGNDADGRIDPGDPVAVLDDPNCILDDVPENYIVNIADARINFSDDDQIGFPEPGRAEATIDEGPDDGN